MGVQLALHRSEDRRTKRAPGSDVDYVNSTSVRLCAASRVACSSTLSITGIITEERQFDFTLTQSKKSGSVGVRSGGFLETDGPVLFTYWNLPITSVSISLRKTTPYLREVPENSWD